MCSSDLAILVNGIDNGRVITSVLEFDITDIKSVRSEVGVTTFSADTVLESKINFGGKPFTISSSSGGVSTVTSSTSGWTVGIKTGDIVSYARTDVSGTVYNRVKTITPTLQSMTVEAVTTVTSVANGTLPSNAITGDSVNLLPSFCNTPIGAAPGTAPGFPSATAFGQK